MSFYKIVVSPETIQSDIVTISYSGQSVGVYSGMSQILSGGTYGTSLLTGLTIPILITETINDIGYYDPFDGAVLQQDVVTNFIFSSSTGNSYNVNIYNTSDQYQKFLELSKYTIDWGDGSAIQSITSYAPSYISHQYASVAKTYEVTLSQTNPWGLVRVTKKVNLPYQTQTIQNPKGTAYFVSNTGNWSGTPISYNYIFSGDAVNTVGAQVSSNYVTTPFLVSGVTASRLEDLTQYGSQKYVQNKPVYLNRQFYGEVTSINPLYTGYTIQGINYYDYVDGTTLFFMQSSGFTPDNLTSLPITKQESLMNVIDQPQIQTNVYVERGKNSAYERVQRLGEVDNIGDLVNYGYGFFNVEKKV